ncbi:MAG: HAD hydrolase family protein [Patescibacteria group bacterium]
MKNENLNENQSYLKELVANKKGVIFSDLDGVWFDEANNFAPPSQDALETIQSAQEAGFLIVLNSDTGAQALYEFGEELGIQKTALIAEGGSYIQMQDGRVESLVDERVKDVMKRLRGELVQYLIDQGNDVLVGDATAFIRGGQLPPKSNGELFLINARRQMSVGLYSRVVENGQLVVDCNQNDRSFQRLSSLVPDIDVVVRQYPNIGSCLVKPQQQVTKAQAVERFLDLSGYQGPCYMFGDRIMDSMASLRGRVKTCAMGNADLELKEQADVIAPRELQVSDAARYILKGIITNSI